MGRPGPGMEDEEPIKNTCDMPSFISSIEEGKVKVSRNLQTTETSFTDGKVERRPVRDYLNRRVTRSNSRLSLDDGGNREEEEEEEDEDDDDAEGNNNNNCNGGEGGREGKKKKKRSRERKRRASAVEILRRNIGDNNKSSSSSSSFRLMQQQQRGGSEQETRDGCTKNGHEAEEEDDDDGGGGGEWQKSNEEEEESSVTCHHRHHHHHHHHFVNNEESSNGKDHIYCTVYCIDNDIHGNDVQITPDRIEMDLETKQHEENLRSPETTTKPPPALYTLDDLVDPFGDLSAHRMYYHLDLDLDLDHAETGGGGLVQMSCRVCLEEKTVASLLPCCRKAVCDECLKLYVSSQVRVAKAQISCPIPECSGNLEEGLVMLHLANEDVAKYRYFLELSQLDASTKPCPQCSQFTSLKTQNPNRTEHKYKIQCSSCQFVWCFKCHAPWHNGLKCREYRKGDKLLRTWASVIEHGQRNAQKCPQCKIHIQRIEGCDHMTCTQCNTNFCYRCGERYRHLRFFGDHTSNLSVFGCKYRYLPDKPHLRRFIRGSVCATKVLIAPVVLLLVVVLGALALVIGLVFFPVYYACMRIKKQRTRGSVQCF